MTNRPETASTSQVANRSRWILAAVLVMIVSTLGCGDDQRDFLLQFRDGRDQPVAGVLVYYLADGDTTTVGRTGSDGNVIVARKHLQQMPREFGFRLPPAHGPTVTEFDPDRCLMVHSATAETYRIEARAGFVGPEDLTHVPDGWRNPGRIIRLDLAPSDDGREPEVLYTVSMEISVPIRTSPDARVKVDGISVGRTDASGDLTVSFCWLVEEAGEYVPRPAIDVEIAKSGHETWRKRVRIPDDGELDPVEAPLERLAGPAVADGTEGADATEDADVAADAYANLRVKLMTSNVRACGDDFMALPVLYVNDETTGIRLPQDRGNGWDNNEFDLIVKAGQEYCLAVACPGPADETTWLPWNASANEPLWFRLRVPADARQMVVHLTDDLDPTRPLQPEPGKVPSGFDGPSRVTVRSGCRR